MALSPAGYGWVSPLVQVVPYVTTIFGGLRAGKMVMLQGVVPLKAHRYGEHSTGVLELGVPLCLQGAP